jgi:hypothetical protein
VLGAFRLSELFTALGRLSKPPVDSRLVDGDSQIRIHAKPSSMEGAVSDPFTDFMTGQISEKLVRFDRLFYCFLYLALAGGVLALGAVMMFT